jgi:hypothetical protein
MLEEFKGGEFLASEAVFFFLIADKKKMIQRKMRL